MRLWSQQLLPYLDNYRLLSQHRECCALRGNGWGKKHSVVDYVFTHDPAWLVAYHWLVIDEMKRRGYHPDPLWECVNWRGNILGLDTSFTDPDFVDDQYCYAIHKHGIIFDEHNSTYLKECIDLLKKKGAPIDWSKVNI